MKIEHRIIQFRTTFWEKKTKSFFHYGFDITNGEIELKFRSLIAWHFDKFCGVISIEYSNNIMLSVDLRANPAAIPIYPPLIAKKIPALYNRRHWPK